jgi:ribosomal protein S3
MGYLKKVGDSAKVVRQASSIALTKLGISGIKVGILPPDAKIHDKIEIDDNLKKFLKAEPVIEKVEEQKAKKPRKKKEKLDETKEQAEEKN